MKIPRVDELDVIGKKVLLRADVDVGETLGEGDEIKLQTNKKTINFLLEKECKIIIVGHRGRPEGRKNENLSLALIAERLGQILNLNIEFVQHLETQRVRKEIKKLSTGSIVFLENLRFDSREEDNNEEFARSLSELGDVYVNEAFSASAREHSSIVGVPKLLPHAAGFHFINEAENLNRVLDKPKRPVIVIMGGVKRDKLDFLDDFKKFADKILIGGRLPEYIPDMQHETPDAKVVVARLIPDKEDITLHSIEAFEKEIEKAKTIVLSGPMGKFEEGGHRQGTERIFKAVVDSSAFKVAGGGDTQQAIKVLSLVERFSWVSVGGGAMLEFFANGTLPGIDALIN